MKYIYLSLLTLALLTACDSNKSNNSTELAITDSTIDSLLNLYPDSIPLLVYRGNKYLDAYDFYAALKDGARAFRLDSMRADVRMVYANALNNKENRSVEEVLDAQRHFQFVTIKEPKNTDALVALATTYRYLQDVDNAFKYVNNALKIDNKKRDAYVLKGSLYLDLGNYDLAKSSYETAIQQDPNFYEAYYRLALLYHRDANPIALEYYLTATELRPQEDEFLYAYAFALESFGKIDESKVYYRKLSQRNEPYYKARGNFHLGHLKQRVENEVDSAIYYFTQAINIQKDYVEAYHNRGMCYEVKGYIQDAKQEYLQALKYDEEFELSVEAYNRLTKKK